MKTLPRDAWRKLAEMPRRTLTQRIAYWEVRRQLEAQPPIESSTLRVRPYVGGSS